MQETLGQNYIVCEEGLGGRTAAFNDPEFYGLNGCKYFEIALRTCEPVDCVIFLLGTNDTKDGFRASAEAITQGMERLLCLCKELLRSTNSYDARIILACPPKPARAGDGSYWYGFSESSTRKVEEMRDTYMELAEQIGCRYFDVNKVAHVDPADGIHLDAKSHKRLGRAMAEEVKALFEKDPILSQKESKKL